MTSPDRSHRATRRRVFVFICVCLLALLAVGFWPVNYYQIPDRTLFVESLGDVPFRHSRLPIVVTEGIVFPSELGVLEQTYHSPPGITPAIIEITPQPSAHYADEETVVKCRVGSVLKLATVARRSGAKVYSIVDEIGNTSLLFCFRNVSGTIWVDPRADADLGGKTREQFALECLDTILKGLEREVSGVHVENMPPAFQLWHNKGAPFLRKHFPASPRRERKSSRPFLKEHFP